MRLKFFISPPSETSWKVNTPEFKERLLAQWPDTITPENADLPPEQAYALEWTTRISGRVVEGGLDSRERVVVLSGDIEDCARFAVWFRALVPESQELICYDEDYTVDVALKKDTSNADIVAAFSA